MDPIFTEEQLDRMSSRDMRSLLKIMTRHQQKQEETLQKQEARIQLLEEQKKELEFLNAMLSDRLTHGPTDQHIFVLSVFSLSVRP